VTQAAKSIDGVRECQANYKAGTAEVTFNPSKTTPEIIAKVISEKTGYKVRLPGKRRGRGDA
jgi:copper chaperone CopZ